MMKIVQNFLIRWLVCSLGLWIAAGLLRGHISYGSSLTAVWLAGFILAVLNMFIKPLFIILSLPAIVVTLGLFMVIINGFMVYLASKLYTPLHITSFWAAVFAGMVIGLVNFIVSQFVRST